MERPTKISDFKFNTLQKYLLPVYSAARNKTYQSEEDKRQFFRKLSSEFFKRMREYRGLPLEQIASTSGLSVEVVKAFESGEGPNNMKIELAYCHACCGHKEFHYFIQELYEIQYPSVNESKYSIAMDALKRFDVIIPTVDYKHLHTPRGKILEFPIAKK